MVKSAMSEALMLEMNISVWMRDPGIGAIRIYGRMVPWYMRYRHGFSLIGTKHRNITPSAMINGISERYHRMAMSVRKLCQAGQILNGNKSKTGTYKSSMEQRNMSTCNRPILFRMKVF